MVNVIKGIDVVSHADGMHYTSLRQYEKSLESKGNYIMEDKQYKQLKEKIQDESRTPKKKPEEYNHVHIDLANDRVIKSFNKDVK